MRASEKNKIKEELKIKLREEAYNNFIETLSLFGEDVDVEASKYKNRVMNKWYGHSHYNAISRLLKFAYHNLYSKGDCVVLDIFMFTNKPRVRINATTWVMKSKKGNNYVDVTRFDLVKHTEITEHVRLS